MKEWLIIFTEYSSVIINAVAVLVVVYGTIEAFVALLRTSFGATTSHSYRSLYLRYAHFLIGGLTFQLAADIVETAIAPDWEEIGRLAAIAAIRTFLNFFLERDISEVREAGPGQGEGAAPTKT